MFSPTTWEFFEVLKENNHKDWFHANKKSYNQVKTEYQENAAKVLQIAQNIDISLSHLEPKNTLFRINRDIRFSKDKSPYKTHLAYGINPFGKKMASAGYYVHFEKDNVFVGGGMYMPDAASLKKIRAEINYFFEEFKTIVEGKDFKNYFGGLDYEENLVLKTSPKNYDIDNPAIEFLKLKSFTAIKKLDNKYLTSEKTLVEIEKAFKSIYPLVNFINRALTVEEEEDFSDLV